IGNNRAKAISENEPNYEPDCESDCEVRHRIAIHRPDRTSPAIILRQEPLRRIVIEREGWAISHKLPWVAATCTAAQRERCSCGGLLREGDNHETQQT